MHYVGIFTYPFIPYYASAIHKHSHTYIIKPFVDSEPMGLKVDIKIYGDFYFILFKWVNTTGRRRSPTGL